MIHAKSIISQGQNKASVDQTLINNALQQRGITANVIEALDIRATRRGWVYPIPGGYRCKTFPGVKGPKYYWSTRDGSPASMPAHVRLYGPAGLQQHIADAGGVLILAAGEVDLWSLMVGGVFNAACTLHGEASIPDWLIDELTRLGVRTVRYYPDRDDTGLRAAHKLRQALAGSGISLELYALPGDVGSKADINTLLQAVGPDALSSALAGCDALILPEPDSTPAPTLERTTRDVPGDTSELYERYSLDVERAAVTAWAIDPNTKATQKGLWSRKNFSSPLRPDDNPSARWNYTTHGFKDFVTDEFYNAQQVADLLGFQSWESYKAEHAPDQNSDRGDANLLQNSVKSEPTRFPHGLPYTLNKRLVNAHRHIDVKAQHPAAAVAYLWHVVQVLDDVWFTAGGFRAAAEAADYTPSRSFVDSGLEQLAAWGMVDRLEVTGIETLDTVPTDGTCEFCNLYTCDTNVYRLQKCHVGTVEAISRAVAMNGTITLYRFRPWQAQLQAVAEHWRYMVRESAYADAPDDVHAEFGDLTTSEIAALTDYRAPVVDASQDRRADAAQKHQRDLGYLTADFDRIRAGRYRPIEHLESPLRKASDYADALKTAACMRHGGTYPNANRMQYETGRSIASEARARERVQAITIEQTRVIPAENVSDYQRDYGLVLREFENGMAEVKAPSAEKLITYADPDECAAYEQLQERQRQRAEKSVDARRREALRDVTPAAQFTPDEDAQTVRKPALVPDTFTDDYRQRQYDMFPLPVDFKPYDEVTGELYSPRDLWKRAAQWLQERHNHEQAQEEDADAETPGTYLSANSARASDVQPDDRIDGSGRNGEGSHDPGDDRIRTSHDTQRGGARGDGVRACGIERGPADARQGDNVSTFTAHAAGQESTPPRSVEPAPREREQLDTLIRQHARPVDNNLTCQSCGDHGARWELTGKFCPACWEHELARIQAVRRG